jgi:NCAIR mutase (PurE)-related protein
MEQREMRELLEAVAQGTVSAADAAVKLETAPVVDLGYARVDNQRGIRRGVSEVVYGAGKTPDQIAGIVASMLGAGEPRVLITRVGADAAREVEELLSDGLTLAASGSSASEDAAGTQVAAATTAAGAVAPAEAMPSASAAAKPSADAAGAPAAAGVPDLPVFTYYDLPRVALVGEMPEPTSDRTVVVCSGGTSDIPVAEEAALTAEVLGCRVERLYDVGVAGAPSAALTRGRDRACDRHRRRRRHGGRASERRRRAGVVPGCRRADERGVRRVVRRRIGAAQHAQLVCRGRLGRQHRQRIRRRGIRRA